MLSLIITLISKVLMKDNFGRRMRNTADKVGGISALSRRSGVATRTIKGYIDGENDPSRKKLIALAKAANVMVEWLATGRGSMQYAETIQGNGKITGNHNALNLKDKGHVFEKIPPFNSKLLGSILAKLADFKMKNPNILTKEKEMDVITLSFSLCHFENEVEAKLIYEILQDYQKEGNDKTI